MNEVQGLIASFFLLATVFLYTFWPDRSAATQHVKTRLDYLLERKEQLYENLRDLNFEHRAGKYPQEDFEAQRSSLERETATLLNEIASLQKT